MLFILKASLHFFTNVSDYLSMKNIKYLIFFIVSFESFLVSYAEEPKKYLYYMGGGGEPKGESTNFDGNLKSIGKFSKSEDWQTTFAFNGGHKKTEEILSSQVTGRVIPGGFIEKNYNELVDEMILKIKSGQIKRGDQLMISIDTHGAKQGKDDKSHRVAFAYETAKELTNLTGARTAKLDNLEELAKLAGDNGVKLAILDLSCFSGNTQKIKNKNVCVISASGPDQYSYGDVVDFLFFKWNPPITFGGKLISSFKKGKNLEELFLNAREIGNVADYPMISSPEGQFIDEKLYPLLNRYLNYNEDSTLNYHQSYERGDEKKFNLQICQIENQFDSLNELLLQLNNMVKIGDGALDNEFLNLKNALSGYRSYQMDYEKSLRVTFDINRELTDVLKKDFPNDEKDWKSYTPLKLLSIDFDYNLKFYEKLRNEEKNENSRKIWQKTLDSLERQKIIAKELESKINPEMRKRIDAQSEVFTKSNVTKEMATKVAVEAKKVYNKIYRAQQKTENNPCREFVL
jgi:hypothetical protein